jgi:hypothetical protein
MRADAQRNYGRIVSAALEVLSAWLREVTAYSTTTRGLAASSLNAPAEESDSCGATLVAAGEPLRRRAVDEGSVRPDAATADLLTLVDAISLAAQELGATEAERLVTLALEGVRPRSRQRRG